jgi:hypothetical protein
MIPIKILCACGQKYCFEADPNIGNMSLAVQCPVCGADGTTAASQVMAKHLRGALQISAPEQVEQTAVADSVPLPPRRRTKSPGIDRSANTTNARSLPVSIAVLGIMALLGLGLLGVRGHTRKRTPAPAYVESNDGLPKTLKGLNAWYVEPLPGQNAADIYLPGFEAVQFPNAGNANLPIFGKGQMPSMFVPVSGPVRSALAAFVNANSAALKTLSEGAKYDQCRYPLDLNLGYDVVYNCYTKLEKASLLLELAALFHADADKAPQAANDLVSGLALAGSLRAAPTTLSQIMRNRCISYSLSALEQTVNRLTLPPGACNELMALIDQMEVQEERGDWFNRTLAGERAMGLVALGDPGQLLRGLMAPDLKMTADRRRLIISRLESGKPLIEERAFFEGSFRQLMAARKQPFPQRLQADDLGRQLVEEAAGRKLFVLDLLLPSLGRRTSAEAECLARLRIGATALALERYHAAHTNRYPAGLVELVPEYLKTAPSDPFDGEPLRYHPKSDSYALYSIGPDLKDNHGEPKRGREGDIVFAVVSPTSRR